MVESIVKLLETGLSLWVSKEKTKYIDKLIQLKKDWYEEYNKPLGKRSDAVLDSLDLELRQLGDAFCTSVGKSQASDK